MSEPLIQCHDWSSCIGYILILSLLLNIKISPNVQTYFRYRFVIKSSSSSKDPFSAVVSTKMDTNMFIRLCKRFSVTENSISCKCHRNAYQTGVVPSGASRQTTLRTLSNSPSQTHSDFFTLFCRQMNNKQLLVIYATTLGNWVVRVRLDSLSQEAAIIK